MLKFFATVATCVIVMIPMECAFAQSLRLNCVQQSRHMCEQQLGCKTMQDAAPNQWTFILDIARNYGKVRRCAGKDCTEPYEVETVRRSATGEITLWESVANESFTFSSDLRTFTHSLTGARGSGGHVVAEFGHCARL
jgi:hypothetical protein